MWRRIDKSQIGWGLVFLVSGLAALLLIAFVGDPLPGTAAWSRQATLLSAILAFFVLGSHGVALALGSVVDFSQFNRPFRIVAGIAGISLVCGAVLGFFFLERTLGPAKVFFPVVGLLLLGGAGLEIAFRAGAMSKGRH